MHIRFTLRCIQYMVTNALQSEQFTFGVRECQVGRNLHQVPRCKQSFFSGMDSSHRRFFASGIQKFADR